MKHVFISRTDGVAIIATTFGGDPHPSSRRSEIQQAVRATRRGGVCLSSGCKLSWNESYDCYLLSGYAADGSDVTHELRLHGALPIQPQPRASIAAPPPAQPLPRSQREPTPAISHREVVLGVVSDRARHIRHRAPVKRMLDYAARFAS
jgi:hypothetical protein